MIEFFFKGQLNKIIKLRKLNLVNDMGKVFGIIAIFCGVLGFAMLVCVFAVFVLINPSLYLWSLAIVFGVIGQSKDDPKGMSRAGLMLGVLGLVLYVPLSALLVMIYLQLFD